MLVLAPKFHEEMIFQNGDSKIRLKFFLNDRDQVRVAITAPLSVSVSRERIKEPVKVGDLCKHHLLDKQGS